MADNLFVSLMIEILATADTCTVDILSRLKVTLLPRQFWLMTAVGGFAIYPKKSDGFEVMSDSMTT
jgi:hypothetical protein